MFKRLIKLRSYRKLLQKKTQEEMKMAHDRIATTQEDFEKMRGVFLELAKTFKSVLHVSHLPYASGEVTCPSCLCSFPQKEALQDFDQDNILCPLCFSNWLKLYVSGHIKKFSDLIPPTMYKC